MTFSKITIVATAIAFLSLGGVANATETTETTKDKSNTDTQQAEIDAVLEKFGDLKRCDGSKRAENICKQYCTGEGTLWGIWDKGNCSHQEIWDKCRKTCRSDLLTECSTTATNKKNNLKGTADCK